MKLARQTEGEKKALKREEAELYREQTKEQEWSDTTKAQRKRRRIDRKVD